jgi:type II secretory pathway component PulJ
MIAMSLLVIVLAQLVQLQRSVRLAQERMHRPPDWRDELRATRTAFASDCAHFLVPGFLKQGETPIDLTRVEGTTPSGSITFFTVEYEPAGLSRIVKVTWAASANGPLTRSVTDPIAGAVPVSTTLMAKVQGVEFRLNDGQQFIPQWGRRLGLPAGIQVIVTTARGPLVLSKMISGELGAMP